MRPSQKDKYCLFASTRGVGAIRLPEAESRGVGTEAGVSVKMGTVTQGCTFQAGRMCEFV